MKKHPVRIIQLLFIVLFNIAAWTSRRFSDWYTAVIFPIWGRTYGRLTSLAPFSVGEWALILGLIILAVFLIRLLIALPALNKGKEDFYKRMGDWPGGLLDLILSIAVIMSLNCFVLYHTTPLDTQADARSYTGAELAALRDMLVEECNSRGEQLSRDENGQPVFAGEMEEEAREAVNRLGERMFPRLAGYSVRPKTFFFSGFVSQQEMMGYYFPFTMEANVNGLMEPLNKPFTMCHELSHTHGYIYEDEANFLGFLACIGSDDPAFVYSGYLGVLIYVDNDFLRTYGKEAYAEHPQISNQVIRDLQFLSDENWAEVEDNAVLDTEMVSQATDIFIDQNQKWNGISAGKAAYTHVVALLLSYYSGDASYLK